jgi:signal transduction histidine kinase
VLSVAATGIASAIAFIEIVVILFNIRILMNAFPHVLSPDIPTVVCILLSAAALFSLRYKRFLQLNRHFPLISGIVISITGLLSSASYLFDKPPLFLREWANVSILTFLTSPPDRMSAITAILFSAFGVVLILLGIGTRRAAAAGHTILLAVSMLAYLVVIGYLFTIPELYTWKNGCITLSTSIAVFCLCIAAFCIRTDTWFMKVFTDQSAGAAMAQRLLPFLLLLPLLIGWLRLHGERWHIFGSEVGVTMVAVTYTLCYLWVVWFNARAINRTDALRLGAEEELRKANKELENQVRERTLDLQKALDIVQIERRRVNDLLDMLPVYVILLTENYRVAFANKFFRERFGQSGDKRCHEYLFNRSEPCSNCETYKVLSTGLPHRWEWIGPDRRNYDVYDFVFPGSDGARLIMEMGIDITDRKRAEAALIESNEMKILGQLTSGVAHEVRNPLNGIMAIIGALAKELSDNERFNPYMEHLRSQVIRLTNLMEELLLLGRPLREKNLANISVITLLENAISTWKQTLHPPRPNVRIEKPATPEHCMIKADSMTMTQVIINLLENAHHYSPPETDIICTVDCGEKDSVILSVKDRGVGIPKDVLPRIYEPFFTTRKGGSGLGLSIVRHVVESHQGSVSAHSNTDGPGTTFLITLPQSNHK